jgi:four helix bundle protein
MTNDKIQMTNESLNPNKKYDIQVRTLEFAARIARFVDMVPKKQTSIEYCKQLIRSSASIGSNIEEADGTLSKRDFINKIAISRR